MHPDKILSEEALVYLLGHSFDVACPGQILGDIYTCEIGAFDHLHFNAIIVYRGMCTALFPEVSAERYEMLGLVTFTSLMTGQ